MKAFPLLLSSLFLLLPSNARGEEYIGVVKPAENITAEQWEAREAEAERAKIQKIKDQRQETVRMQQREGLQPAVGLPPGAGVQAVDISQAARFQNGGQQAYQGGGGSGSGGGNQKKKEDYDEKIEKTSQVLGHNIGLLTNGDQEKYTKELESVYQMQLEAVRNGEGKPVAGEFRKFVEKKMKKVED